MSEVDHNRAYKTEAPIVRLGRKAGVGVRNPDGPILAHSEVRTPRN